MKPETTEWVVKAEEDFHATERESRVRKNPAFGVVCFHAQQCAEKYLKARLVEAGIEFPFSHYLPGLLNLVVAVEPLWEPYREDLAFLSQYAVSFRYPGFMADRESILDARKRCRRFRIAAREALGIES